jgi:hypothetical protein
MKLPKLLKPEPTGLAMAAAPVIIAFAIVGAMIGLNRAGVHVGVNVVDHHYDPAIAAELNKNNCTRYLPNADESVIAVSCDPSNVVPAVITYTEPKRFGWRPSFDYSLPTQ